MPTVSVLMPTFKQREFIARALDSLLAQSFSDWEAVIVDDGSPDNTYAVVEPYLSDKRITYHRLDSNTGLGAALNYALDKSTAALVAYLPSDDYYYANHLSSLIDLLRQELSTVLAYSGIRHHYNRTAPGQMDGFALQPVQVMHRRTSDRWLERSELVTDNIDRMYWSRLRPLGKFSGTGQVTCEWVDHPGQRYKRLREPVGGINPYRRYYGAQEPLRFHTTVGNFIDEQEQYRRFRERPATPSGPDSLKILLVGELAYNADRVLALEELGNRLYGLWMPDPYWYNTVGPLPFGHVQDLHPDRWQKEVKRIKPDIIYALLNWQAVPFAHHVLQSNPGIPFVWHFKEGPFICLEKGTWSQLVDLYRQSDGQIYITEEMRNWTETAIPGSVSQGLPYVLDGDMPKKEWFEGKLSARISEMDGEIHTVVPGRPIGLHPTNVVDLAEQGIHLHFYGDFTHGQWFEWIQKTLRLAPRHIHLHRHVDQPNWVAEFSRYDAGWLHFFGSQNNGEIRQANWDDLNYPARISTLLSAGLPLLQRDNGHSIVATQNLVKKFDIGFFFNTMSELRQQLQDQAQLEQVRENIWNQRPAFTFDYHAPALVDYFRSVIDRARKQVPITTVREVRKRARLTGYDGQHYSPGAD
jgi:glycosyltransferase involved in cell wall biosynthesis